MKITEFKVVYICPDHNEKYHLRKLHMDELLKNIGFTNVEHYKSSTENYPDCLSEATINILKANLENPVIILEDDIEWTGKIDIEYNSDCDAIYLGLSKCGGHPVNNIDLGSSQFDKWSNTQVKVLNMLGGHAILYISKKYKDAIIDILNNNKNRKYYNDVLFSRIQSKYLVLAEKVPLFYQAGKFNSSYHVEYCTRITIDL